MTDDTITVRITLHVEVTADWIGDDTLDDVRDAVEEVAGAVVWWLDESEAGAHGDREFRSAWRHARKGKQYQTTDPRWQSVDIADVAVIHAP